MQLKKLTMDMNCKHVSHAVCCVVLGQWRPATHLIISLTFDYLIFHKTPALVVPRKIVYQIFSVEVIKYSFLPQQTVPTPRVISQPCHYEVSVNQVSAVIILCFY